MASPAFAAFDKHRDQFVQELFAFLRFPTISAQPERAGDIKACAEWVAAQLNAAGVKARVVPTKGHPAVVGDTGPAERPGPTLLVYGHYDVQPIGDPALWQSSAFEPTVRDGAIYARGSADDKGQVMIHMAAMRSFREAGVRPPVRIKFLLEGEEEIGSPNLPALLESLRGELACDAVLISDTGKFSADIPALTCATRGLVYKEITVEGPGRDLHSGIFGGAVANPANVLAAIIASLHDADGRVTIPGFYDDVRPLTPEDRAAIAEASMSDAELLAVTGSPAPCGEAGYTSSERRGARPTLDVNGIFGGYTGTGAATIIPSKASAKISMRLVPDQDPERISAAFSAAIKAACPVGAKVSIRDDHGCRAYVAPMDSPLMKLAAQALGEAYGRPAVSLREGGTLPILPLFKRVLGADSIMPGFANPDANIHSPNEYLHLRDFDAGVRTIIRFLELAGA